MISWLRIFVLLLLAGLLVSLYILFSQVKRLGREIQLHRRATSRMEMPVPHKSRFHRLMLYEVGRDDEKNSHKSC